MDRQTILKLEIKKFDYYDMGRFTIQAAKEVRNYTTGGCVGVANYEIWFKRGANPINADLCQLLSIPPELPKIGIGKNREKLKFAKKLKLLKKKHNYKYPFKN